MDDQQILTLKKQLQRELRQLDAYLEVSEEAEPTELSSADNHPADSATDLTNQLTDMAIDTYREQNIEKIKIALDAMKNGTYGVCTACGVEIPYARLEAIPTALTCVEHSDKELDMHKRPVEEQVLNAAIPPIDFETDGEMASSDTPSDRM